MGLPEGMVDRDLERHRGSRADRIRPAQQSNRIAVWLVVAQASIVGGTLALPSDTARIFWGALGALVVLGRYVLVRDVTTSRDSGDEQ